MFKTFIKRIVCFFLSAAGVLLLLAFSAPALQVARATNIRPQDVTPTPPGTPIVTLAQPGVTGTTFSGHSGTAITITGSGFVAGITLNLYTTPDSATQCGAGTTNLAELTTLNADSQGNFSLSPTNWPNNANTPNKAYYICAIAQNGSERAISQQSFTVLPAVTVMVSIAAVAPGDQVVLTGANWLPIQPLTIALSPAGQTNPILSDHVTPDNTGAFSKTLTIPTSVAAGNYTISVVADNEPTLKFTQDNFITVNALTPTPTPAPTVTPTPTITATVPATATSTTPATQGNNGNTGGSGGAIPGGNVLIFSLGGLGVLMVVIGIIMFAVYSRPVQS